MSTYRTQPPWEFLFNASRNTLHSYELSRLGHAANLKKEITSLLDQLMDENANAMVARVLLEQRDRATEKPEPADPTAGAAGEEQTAMPKREGPAAPDDAGTGLNGSPIRSRGEFASHNILGKGLARTHALRRRA